LIAVRIIKGFGLPTKKAFFPVAFSIKAANAPPPGTIPFSEGPLASGFVAINLAPLATRRMALVKASWFSVSVSPRIT
jgi:hypothetical protein